MRIEQLAYFYEAAKYKSMSAAAEVLHLTPQALSMSIKGLENELGTKLLEKSPAGVSLTAKGEEIMPLAEEVLERIAAIKKCCQRTEGQRDKLKGQLHVYTTLVLSDFYIGHTLTTFGNQYPDVRFHLHVNTASDVIKNLQDDVEGIGIMNVSSNRLKEIEAHVSADMRLEVLYASKVSAIVSGESPLAKQTQVSFKQLIKYPLLLATEQNLRDYGLEDIMRQQGNLRIGGIYNNTQLLINNAVKNQGVAFAFNGALGFLEEGIRGRLKAVSIKGAPVLFIVAACHQQTRHRSPVTEYLEAARAFFNLLPNNLLIKQ